MADQRAHFNAPVPSELVRTDPEFTDLVEEFLNGMPERVAQLEGALAGQDFDLLRYYAHQLKGSGGGYGYPTVTEYAARLEQQAAAAQIEVCQQGLEELKNLLRRLVVSTD